MPGSDDRVTDATPRATESTQPGAMVGLGASAGGLEALERLLPAVSPGGYVSFVVVQHLSPEHASILPQFLASSCKLPVQAATDGIAPQPDNVYVTPPNAALVVRDGQLQLGPLEPRIVRLPINALFNSNCNQRLRAVRRYQASAAGRLRSAHREPPSSGVALEGDLWAARRHGRIRSVRAFSVTGAGRMGRFKASCGLARKQACPNWFGCPSPPPSDGRTSTILYRSHPSGDFPRQAHTGLGSTQGCSPESGAQRNGAQDWSEV